MKKIQDWLDEYAVSHQHPDNKKIHWICVPVIFWSISALLWSISLPIPSLWDLPMNVGVLSLFFISVYYFFLSFSLAIGMTLFTSFCLLLNSYLDHSFGVHYLRILAVLLFSLAWIGQFYGHKIEGKKPSFLKDIQFLMIGPAWLMSFIYKRLNIPL